MCGGCYRCGEFQWGGFGHPRGCALPPSVREAIQQSALPVTAIEAALAAAEDEALRVWGKEGLAERRRAELRERHEAAERESVLGGLPPDLAAVLRDPSIVIPRDAEVVWPLIGRQR